MAVTIWLLNIFWKFLYPGCLTRAETPENDIYRRIFYVLPTHRVPNMKTLTNPGWPSKFEYQTWGLWGNSGWPSNMLGQPGFPQSFSVDILKVVTIGTGWVDRTQNTRLQILFSNVSARVKQPRYQELWNWSNSQKVTAIWSCPRNPTFCFKDLENLVTTWQISVSFLAA